MRDFNNELSAYGLTKETYEACLEDIKDKYLGINDMDWQEIIEKYNLNIHYDTLRKASQTIFGNIFVTDYFKDKYARENTPTTYLEEIRQAKIDLAKERQKLRDEKLEYNKWIREQSRDELICERVCDEIRNMKPLNTFKETTIRQNNEEAPQEAILCFADTHYGCEFEIKGLYGEIINKYNPEIFEERMLNILNDTIKTIKEKKLKKIRVFSLGDELDGILRVSQLQKLRYGIIESAIKYSEFICEWLNELSKHAYVDFYTVQGNHTELRLIAQPKGTFTNENMSLIINEFIKERMKDNPNFKFHSNDNGLIFDNICGFNILGIHGEVKNMDNAILQFTNTYNVMIDVLVGGHKHHFAAETVGKLREVINIPSVVGIDDYAMSLGKASSAGALLLVLEKEKGVVEQRHFKL